MAFEGYAVAVELALKNNVSRGLAAITSDFGMLNKHIASAHDELDRFRDKMTHIQRMGAMGVGIAAAGFGTLSLLKGPYEAAKRLEQAKVDFENLNLSASDNSLAFATAAANAHNVLGTNITENIQQINDLHTAFGELSVALAMRDVGGAKGIATLAGNLGTVGGQFKTLTQAAGLFMAAYAGWKFGEYAGNKIDKNIQESSGYGIYQAFQAPDKLGVSIVASASGVLVSFIGGSFLLIYRSILEQSKDYVTVLERINAVGMAVQVIASIPDSGQDLKNKTTADLAKQLLGLYAASAQSDKRRVKGRTNHQMQ